MAFGQGWQEVCLVEVQQFASSTPKKWQFAAITESIDIGEPDYPWESVPNIAGGRVPKQSPQEDGEITLELYPIELDAADDANNKGLFQQFAGGSYDSSEPLTSDSAWAAGVDRTRDRFRVVVLWTNSTGVTTASGATSASTDALRFVALGCRFVSHKAEFTDGILKVTATFKWPAMNKAGSVRMCQWQSGDNTALTSSQLAVDYDDEDSYT